MREARRRYPIRRERLGGRGRYGGRWVQYGQRGSALRAQGGPAALSQAAGHNQSLGGAARAQPAPGGHPHFPRRALPSACALAV